MSEDDDLITLRKSNSKRAHNEWKKSGPLFMRIKAVSYAFNQHVTGDTSLNELYEEVEDENQTHNQIYNIASPTVENPSLLAFGPKLDSDNIEFTPKCKPRHSPFDFAGETCSVHDEEFSIYPPTISNKQDGKVKSPKFFNKELFKTPDLSIIRNASGKRRLYGKMASIVVSTNTSSGLKSPL